MRCYNDAGLLKGIAERGSCSVDPRLTSITSSALSRVVSGVFGPFSSISVLMGQDVITGHMKNCGLSVVVSRAEYCLNRNSCAALYPDVANRMCVCMCVCVCVCLRGSVQGGGRVGPCG